MIITDVTDCGILQHEMTSPGPRLYMPLDRNVAEIRLLEIVSTDEDLVCCRLEVVSLFEIPPFAALSYVWEDPTVTETIKANKQTVAVTVNLANALRHVKSQWLSIFPGRDESTFRI